MPTASIICKREEVYAAVWSEPVRDAARKFGVSDVMLRKICRKLNVPLPPQGYWVRSVLPARVREVG